MWLWQLASVSEFCWVGYDHGDILPFVRRRMILEFSSFSGSLGTLIFLEIAVLMINIVSFQSQDFRAAVCYAIRCLHQVVK